MNSLSREAAAWKEEERLSLSHFASARPAAKLAGEVRGGWEVSGFALLFPVASSFLHILPALLF